MSFINPAKIKIDKLEEQLNLSNKNNNIKENDDQFVSLESILKDDKKENIQIEYISFSKFSSIRGVPRNINLNYSDVGKLIMKYENSIENQKVL